MGRAIAVFARVLHIDGHAREILHHDLAHQSGMSARSAGGNDDLLKRQQRVFNRMQHLRKQNVPFDIAANRFANRAGLLIDFPQHVVGERADIRRLSGQVSFSH